jgi:hypothetical protein
MAEKWKKLLTVCSRRSQRVCLSSLADGMLGSQLELDLVKAPGGERQSCRQIVAEEQREPEHRVASVAVVAVAVGFGIVAVLAGVVVADTRPGVAEDVCIAVEACHLSVGRVGIEGALHLAAELVGIASVAPVLVEGTCFAADADNVAAQHQFASEKWQDEGIVSAAFLPGLGRQRPEGMLVVRLYIVSIIPNKIRKHSC